MRLLLDPFLDGLDIRIASGWILVQLFLGKLG
jgi:hypothetical protein